MPQPPAEHASACWPTPSCVRVFPALNGCPQPRAAVSLAGARCGGSRDPQEPERQGAVAASRPGLQRIQFSLCPEPRHTAAAAVVAAHPWDRRNPHVQAALWTPPQACCRSLRACWLRLRRWRRISPGRHFGSPRCPARAGIAMVRPGSVPRNRVLAMIASEPFISPTTRSGSGRLTQQVGAEQHAVADPMPRQARLWHIEPDGAPMAGREGPLKRAASSGWRSAQQHGRAPHAPEVAQSLGRVSRRQLVGHRLCSGGLGGRLGRAARGMSLRQPHRFHDWRHQIWCVAAAAVQRRLDGICLPAPGVLSRPGGSVNRQPGRQILGATEIQ